MKPTKWFFGWTEFFGCCVRLMHVNVLSDPNVSVGKFVLEFLLRIVVFFFNFSVFMLVRNFV